MKYYIRTKETIFEVVDDNAKMLIVRAKGNPNHLYNKSRIQTEILQQANTIEELCDEFVLHYEDTMEANIPIPWASYERRDDNWPKNKEKLISEINNKQRKATVYGAIWTPKGLIYVAKMNEDGELVLL